MAVIDSFANMECIINGHRFVGWAAEDPPFEFDYEDAVDTEFGPDGALYAMGMPSLGGTWTFKMFPRRRLRNGQCSRNRRARMRTLQAVGSCSMTGCCRSLPSARRTGWKAALSCGFQRWRFPALPTKG